MSASAAALLGGIDPGLDRLATRLLTEDGIVLDPTALVAVVLAPGLPGERLRALRAAVADSDRAVVALMPAGAGNALLRKALIAGARGIVLDDTLAVSLAATVRAVAAGQLVVPTAMRNQIAPRALSHREREIVTLVGAGWTNRQVADHLFLAESTVKTHLASAFEKLDVNSRAEAAAMLRDPLGRLVSMPAEDRLEIAR